MSADGRIWTPERLIFEGLSIKQLDIHLLFRKMQLFEEACNTVLDDYHLSGLHLLSKKTLKESKKSRKKYRMQDLIYGELERLSQVVSIKEDEYCKQRTKFLYALREETLREDVQLTNKDTIELQREFAKCYQRLQKEQENGDKYSVKIMSRLRPTKESDLISIDLNAETKQQPECKSQPVNKLVPATSMAMISHNVFI